MATSPWVDRNNDYAQYPQPRGSQYEGPNPAIRFTPLCADCDTELLASEHEQGMTTCVDCQVELAQIESIHREELAQARERNYHLSHRDGPLQSDCRFCLERIA